MKKLTALLLALALALGLTACGSNESTRLVGTWQCVMDITKQIDTEISDALDTEYASEVPMQMFLTAVFNEDGTFTWCRRHRHRRLLHRVYTGAEARHCGAELSGGRKARHDPQGV